MWWVTDPRLRVFSAAGIHGQGVFVHGPSRIVVVKLSSWPDALSPAMRGATGAAVAAIAESLASG